MTLGSLTFGNEISQTDSLGRGTSTQRDRRIPGGRC
jgi:hypothetical protein